MDSIAKFIGYHYLYVLHRVRTALCALALKDMARRELSVPFIPVINTMHSRKGICEPKSMYSQSTYGSAPFIGAMICRPTPWALKNDV